MAATCDPIAIMRSQNSSFSAPLGPAVSTNEKVEEWRSGTRLSSHSGCIERFRARRNALPVVVRTASCNRVRSRASRDRTSRERSRTAGHRGLRRNASATQPDKKRRPPAGTSFCGLTTVVRLSWVIHGRGRCGRWAMRQNAAGSDVRDAPVPRPAPLARSSTWVSPTGAASGRHSSGRHHLQHTAPF